MRVVKLINNLWQGCYKIETFELHLTSESLPQDFLIGYWVGLFYFMDTTKICTKCKKDKGLDEFYKAAKHKDGLTNWCKGCFRDYQIANEEKIRQYGVDYRKKTAAYQADRHRAYQLSNRRRISTSMNEYQKCRRKEDLAYRLLLNMRSRVYSILKGKNKSAATLELLGCTVDEFRDHLEQQFTEGMTWDNYGEWHMDHIIPCAAFDQENPEHQKQCWHYSNYSPLWAFDNLSKGDKILPEHEDKLPTNLL